MTCIAKNLSAFHHRLYLPHSSTFSADSVQLTSYSVEFDRRPKLARIRQNQYELQNLVAGVAQIYYAGAKGENWQAYL